MFPTTELAIGITITLIHILWMSTVLGILVWLARCLISNRAAATRYRIFLTALVGQALIFPLAILLAVMTSGEAIFQSESNRTRLAETIERPRSATLDSNETTIAAPLETSTSIRRSPTLEQNVVNHSEPTAKTASANPDPACFMKTWRKQSS